VSRGALKAIVCPLLSVISEDTWLVKATERSTFVPSDLEAASIVAQRSDRGDCSRVVRGEAAAQRREITTPALTPGRPRWWAIVFDRRITL